MLLAFPLFLASDPSVGWHDTARVLAWICVVPGLILSWYSAFRYVPLAREALAARSEEGDRDAREEPLSGPVGESSG
jgi:hypothetical protein